MRPVVNREAARDLDDITVWTFENFGPRLAKTYVAGIGAAFDRLLIGRAASRPADEVSPGPRRLRVEMHDVYFRIPKR